MSALDDLLNERGLGYSYYSDKAKQARAELAQLRADFASAVAERDKWRNWHPDDETLAALQEQAKGRAGSYDNGLAACAVYIGALEARLREYEW